MISVETNAEIVLLFVICRYLSLLRSMRVLLDCLSPLYRRHTRVINANNKPKMLLFPKQQNLTLETRIHGNVQRIVARL